ncbi:MAG TPA: PEP-CTERM sorting domain-containing protein [Chthoniobacterales bacterium]
MTTKIAAGAIALIGLATTTFAQIASDTAGNYGGTWTNGSNGGFGFTPWDLSQNNNNGTDTFAGYFLGDSTAGTGNINDASGNSFGMFANPLGAFANASRAFTEGALQPGQTFSLQMAVNFRNGNKGVLVNSGSSQLFDFNVGNNDYTYSVSGGGQTSLGLSYQADSVFSISFTQTDGTTIQVAITRMSAGGGTETALNQSFNVGAAINNFKFYISGTDNGAAANNLYFNNLQVVPEPSTLALVAAPAIFGALAFVRRRRA